jgi:cytoskeletal protein CcmA (bactofilin family)
MALFGGPDKNAPAASATGRGFGAAPAGLSIVGTGMTVNGDIESGGVVKIEGAVNGRVNAAQQVLVAKGGRIDGDVQTGEAVIAGAVHGAVQGQQRVEIQTGAVVEGDVTTNRILVAEGAVLNGMVRMGERPEVGRSATPKASPKQAPSAGAEQTG